MSSNGQAQALKHRFPALRRLEDMFQSRRIPFVEQLETSECGVACLAMVLAYHGKTVPISRIRAALGGDGMGTDAWTLLRGAESFGLRGRGISVDVDDLEFLPRGSILFWEFNHFVVFERSKGGVIDIVDPARGRRSVPVDELRRSFTGVVLTTEPGENFVRGRHEQSTTWAYLRRLFLVSGNLHRVVIMSALVQLLALGLPLLTGVLVDRVVPRGDHSLLSVLMVGLFAIVSFHFVATLIRGHLLLHIRTHLDSHMTLGFLDHLVDLPYSFFQRRSTGDLMMRMANNATIREFLTSNILSSILDGILASSYLLVLTIADLRLGAIVAGLGFLKVLILLLTRKRQQQLMGQHLQVQARSQAFLVQLLSGIETLKASGSEKRATELWSHLFVDDLNLSLRRGRLSATVDALQGALTFGAPLLILGVGGYLVLDGQISIGVMLALNALAIGFLNPLANFVNNAQQFQLIGTYSRRILDVLTQPPGQDLETVSPAPTLRGGIVAEGLKFRYGTNRPFAVNGVDLSIEPGQCVAIVGRSGSGKSTLASLLIGLLSAEVGRVLYDDRDLSEMEHRSVRSQVGVVTQQAYVFGLSVRHNIAFSAPETPLEEVIQAARFAEIHDEISQLPMGYETVLADSGSSLSGGQRQRISLARALITNPRILVLDEATSALDAVTERKVHQNLQRLNGTRIIIAHRLSTISHADRILVMDRGIVVEEGSHEELVGRNGPYVELLQAQLRSSS